MRKFAEHLTEGQGHDLAREGQKRNLSAQISAAERSLSTANDGSKQSIRAKIDSLRNQLERLQEQNRFTKTFTGPSANIQTDPAFLPGFQAEDAIEDTPSMTANSKWANKRDKAMDDKAKTLDDRTAALADNEPKAGDKQKQQKGKEPFQFSGAVAEQGSNMSAGMGLQPWMRENTQPTGFRGFRKHQHIGESKTTVSAKKVGLMPMKSPRTKEQFEFPDELRYGGRTWTAAETSEVWDGDKLKARIYTDSYGNELHVLNESMDVFKDYHEAYEEAKKQAKIYNRPMGLEKANEYGKTVYRVKMIPKDPKQRFGWETRVQVVNVNEGVHISEELNALAKADRTCDNCTNPIPAGERYQLNKGDATKRHLCKECAKKYNRNANARARYGAMTGLGMKKTAYGWEEFQAIAPLLSEGYYRITVMDGKKEHVIKFQGSGTEVRSKVSELRAQGKEIEEVETVDAREYASEDAVSTFQECPECMKECPCPAHMREFDQGMRGVGFSEAKGDKYMMCPECERTFKNAPNGKLPPHEGFRTERNPNPGQCPGSGMLGESKSAKKALNLPRAPLPQQRHQVFKTRRNELDRKAKHKGKKFDEDSSTASAVNYGINEAMNRNGWKTVKTISSHVGVSRWFDEMENDNPIGWVKSQHPNIATPYSSGPTHSVYRWKGLNVIKAETRHKYYEIIQVPSSEHIYKTDDEATRAFMADLKAKRQQSEDTKRTPQGTIKTSTDKDGKKTYDFSPKKFSHERRFGMKEAAEIKTIDVRSLKAKTSAANKYLVDICSKYHSAIPLDDIFKTLESNGLKPVQEDGTPWSGLLLGRDGRTNIQLKTGGPDRYLALSWHKMDVSGRFEIVAYVS